MRCFYGNLNACQIAFHAHACVHICASFSLLPVLPASFYRPSAGTHKRFRLLFFPLLHVVGSIQFRWRERERDGKRKRYRRANHNQKGYMTERLRQTPLRPKAHQTHHLTSGKTLQAAHTSLVCLSVSTFATTRSAVVVFCCCCCCFCLPCRHNAIQCATDARRL